MSAKGAWARKGGAQLFPQQVPATENSEQAISPANLASENSTDSKSVATEPLDKLDPNIDQEHGETLDEEVNAESLAGFFTREQKLSSGTNGPQAIAEWTGYLTNLWERLRQDQRGCSAALKAYVRERFVEILGWNGTEFVASQVVTSRQLEILLGVLLNHLSNSQNYNSDSVVETNLSLNALVQENKPKLQNLKLDLVESNDNTNDNGVASANNQQERKTRGRQSRGRGSNGNRASNNGGGGNSPGVQYTGRVTRWGSQGFGFIKPDDGGEDLHVNSSDLVGDFNALIVGRRVNFTKRYNERARKYKACRVSGEACTITNTGHRNGQRRPRRRHHRGSNGSFTETSSNGGAAVRDNVLSYGSSNGMGNVGVGYSVSNTGYGGVPYGGVPAYGGVPYTFGGFAAGGFSYAGGFQSPPISPTGAPGYGSPPYGSMGYGGPPISPVSNPSRVAGGADATVGGNGAPEGPIADSSDETAPPTVPPAAPTAP